MATTVGVGIGLVTAGPPGALAGAAVAPVVARIGRGFVRFVTNRADRDLSTAVDEVGACEAFDQLIGQRAELAALVRSPD